MRSAGNSDPYNGFRDDRERRHALDTRACCLMLAAVAWSGGDVAQALHAMIRLLLGRFL